MYEVPAGLGFSPSPEGASGETNKVTSFQELDPGWLLCVRLCFGCRCQKPNSTSLIKSKRNIVGSRHQLQEEQSRDWGRDSHNQKPHVPLS